MIGPRVRVRVRVRVSVGVRVRVRVRARMRVRIRLSLRPRSALDTNSGGWVWGLERGLQQHKWPRIGVRGLH